jgi:polyisoprenoid-binding protein YceI
VRPIPWPRTALAALLLAGAGAGALHAEPLSYQFDPAHSFVHFELLHFGTSTVRGRFGPIEGSVLLDRAAGRGELGLRIATPTLSTGVPVFDARVRQADMLATEAHPEAYFVASRFRFDGAALAEVRGEFTLRGVSQPLSLTARQFACREEDVAGSGRFEVCGGDFEADITRSDFGISFGLPFIANRVHLQIQVEGRRPIQPKR